MSLALRLLVAVVVIVTPTVLFLGLMRGLEKLRDDALLMRLADSDDAPRDVSTAAATVLEKPPNLTDGRPPSDDAVTCSHCGESNMVGARYCQECLGKLG